MITCVFCKNKLDTLRGCVLHCRVHRNDPVIFSNVLAPTVVKHLPLTQLSRAIFIVCTMHLQAAMAVVVDLKCAVSLCARHFHTVKELVSNLNDHNGEGRSVLCPVSGCKNVFTKNSSFTSHMCRKHKACSPDSIDDMYRESRPQPPDVIASTGDSENTHEAMCQQEQEVPSELCKASDDAGPQSGCFDEKEDSMFFHVEDTCLAEEVQLEQVPLTSAVIVCGQSCYSSTRYMLSLDRTLTNTNISFILCCFSINPEKGTKVENKHSKRPLNVNPRVLTLIQELSDHEWR